MHGMWRSMPFCVIESIEVKAKNGYSFSPMLICAASSTTRFLDSSIATVCKLRPCPAGHIQQAGISEELFCNVSMVYSRNNISVHGHGATSKLEDILIMP
jgi:hypothetical protein